MSYRPVLVAFGLETSGISSGQEEIIELGAVRIEEGQIISEFQALVRPQKPISSRISKLTGINQANLDLALPPEKVLPQFLDFLSNHTLITHQAEYKLTILEKYLGKKLINEVLDTYEMARITFPGISNYKLITLARELDLSFQNIYRALGEAKIVVRLFLAIDKELKSWEPELIHRINQIAATFSWSQANYFQFIEKYLVRNFSGSAQGTYRNLAPLTEEDKIRDWYQEKLAPDHKYKPLNIDFLESLMVPGGMLAKNLKNYEFRFQQLKMLRQVAEAFNQDKHLLVEAGTGTGKSLAYLLPAVFLSFQNKERVVISTHTITLQEQLWLKDIPQLRRALEIIHVPGEDGEGKIVNFKAALVKGRNNYICLRKWFSIEQSLEFYSLEEKIFFLRLISWLKKTKTGDRSELNLNQKAGEVWSLVAADSESCLGGKCPWFKNFCFVMRARRRCEEAHLLVVNHSLLLADFKTENQVLPEYRRVIIDEAHHLENVAAERLGVEVGYQNLIALGNRLYRQTRFGAVGFLVILYNRWSNLTKIMGDIDLDPGIKIIEALKGDLENIQEQARKFFGKLVESILSRRIETDQIYNKKYIRLHRELTKVYWWPEWIQARDDLLFQLQCIQNNLELLEKFIESIEEKIAFWINEKRDIQAQRQSYQQFKKDLEFITAVQEEDWVYWAEIDKSIGFNCVIKAVPVEVGKLLKQYFYDTQKSVIMTSATLTVGKNFNYFMERVGLDLIPVNRQKVLQLDSPFVYEEQVLLCITPGIPNPGEVGDKQFCTYIVPVLEEILEATQGRAMVLFTSHYLLQETYQRIRDTLEARGITLLGHNIDGGHASLVEEFRTTSRSVIFGANTLWEGIDIQGENLICVVIAKLPFLPPNFPIVEARIEAVEKKKRNGFYHYTLPEAILRLKQGFGRLIRSQQDRGVVIILDNRVITKSYGHQFLKSLPLDTHIRADLPVLSEKIKQWLTDNY